MILSILGIVEVFVLYWIFHLFHRFVISQYRKKQNKIDQNTNILITGAAIGYGRTLTLEFAKKHKCNIILFEIRSHLCKQLIKEIEQQGGKGYYQECDVSSEEKIKIAVNETLKKFEKIDILINCVGIANMKYFVDSEPNEIENVININCLGPISVIKKILPSMMDKNKGQIVNITSVASILPGVKMTEYCGSKAALNSFHQCMRMEMKFLKKNIDFTLICPYVLPARQSWKQKLNMLFPSLAEEKQAVEMYEAIICKKKEAFIPTLWKQASFILISLPTYFFDKLMLLYTGEFLDKLLKVNKQRKSSLSSQISN